ncbi:hypothetical protein BH11BAC2_BH11BAC2_05730 [soil metagenome]
MGTTKSKVFHSIMLVDDSESDIELSGNLIKCMQISNEVVKQKSVISAVFYLQECVQKKVPFPDIIILDMNMPLLDGNDFIEVFDLFEPAIKKNSHLMLLTSSYDQKRMFTVAENSYIDHVLYKPLCFEQLEKGIDKIKEKRLLRMVNWLNGFSKN